MTGYDWSKPVRDAIEGGGTAHDVARMTVGQWWAVFIQPATENRRPTDGAAIQARINERRRKMGLPPAKPRAESCGG